MKRLLRKIRHLYLIRLKWRNYSFGVNAYIGRAVYMWAKHNITIGDNFYIGKFSQIECDAEIGDNVMMANCVALIGRHDHDFRVLGTPIRLASRIRDDDFAGEGLFERIIIEDDVWIGHGAIILSGVKICTGSIVGAGSVVTRDVEPYAIYAGNPAVRIKARFSSEDEKLEHMRLYSLKYRKVGQPTKGRRKVTN